MVSDRAHCVRRPYGHPFVLVKPTTRFNLLSQRTAYGVCGSLRLNPSNISDLDIPELNQDQLGKGVRGKYLKHFTQGSNVVVLQPEIQKAFPTSEAVNKALASTLAFAQETQGLTGRSSRTPRKRAAA